MKRKKKVPHQLLSGNVALAAALIAGVVGGTSAQLSGELLLKSGIMRRTAPLLVQGEFVPSAVHPRPGAGLLVPSALSTTVELPVAPATTIPSPASAQEPGNAGLFCFLFSGHKFCPGAAPVAGITPALMNTVTTVTAPTIVPPTVQHSAAPVTTATSSTSSVSVWMQLQRWFQQRNTSSAATTAPSDITPPATHTAPAIASSAASNPIPTAPVVNPAETVPAIMNTPPYTAPAVLMTVTNPVPAIIHSPVIIHSAFDPAIIHSAEKPVPAIMHSAASAAAGYGSAPGYVSAPVFVPGSGWLPVPVPMQNASSAGGWLPPAVPVHPAAGDDGTHFVSTTDRPVGASCSDIVNNNDGDIFMDSRDPGCSMTTDLPPGAFSEWRDLLPSLRGSVYSVCSNNIDENGNNLFDMEDPDCHGMGATGEHGAAESL